MATKHMIANVYEEIRKDVILAFGQRFGVSSSEVEDALHTAIVYILERPSVYKPWHLDMVERAIWVTTEHRLMNALHRRQRHAAWEKEQFFVSGRGESRL